MHFSRLRTHLSPTELKSFGRRACSWSLPGFLGRWTGSPAARRAGSEARGGSVPGSCRSSGWSRPWERCPRRAAPARSWPSPWPWRGWGLPGWTLWCGVLDWLPRPVQPQGPWEECQQEAADGWDKASWTHLLYYLRGERCTLKSCCRRVLLQARTGTKSHFGKK